MRPTFRHELKGPLEAEVATRGMLKACASHVAQATLGRVRGRRMAQGTHGCVRGSLRLKGTHGCARGSFWKLAETDTRPHPERPFSRDGSSPFGGVMPDDLARFEALEASARA